MLSLPEQTAPPVAAEFADVPDAPLIAAEVAAEPLGVYAPHNEDEALLCRYLRLRQRLASELTVLQEQMAAMTSHLARRIAGLDFVMGPAAEAAARRLLSAQPSGTRAKSVKLPWGSAGFRSNPGRVVVVDPSRLPPEFVREKTVREPDREAVNAAFKDGGEVPDGCEFLPQTEKFYVK